MASSVLARKEGEVAPLIVIQVGQHGHQVFGRLGGRTCEQCTQGQQPEAGGPGPVPRLHGADRVWKRAPIGQKQRDPQVRPCASAAVLALSPRQRRLECL